MGINIEYFGELNLGNGFVENCPVEVFYQA